MKYKTIGIMLHKNNIKVIINNPFDEKVIEKINATILTDIKNCVTIKQ